MALYVTYDINLYRGDDSENYSFRVEKTGYDWSLGGGSTAKMQWRAAIGQTVLMEMEWDQAQGTATIQGGSPVFTQPLTYENTNQDLVIPLVIPNSLMADIPGGNYVYDLEVTDPDSKVRTYFKGKVNVENDVTRPA